MRRVPLRILIFDFRRSDDPRRRRERYRELSNRNRQHHIATLDCPAPFLRPSDTTRFRDADIGGD